MTQDLLHMWHYDVSSVTFDGDHVVGYWNTDGTLHIELHPKDPAVAARAKASGHYTIGATKDEVIAIEGTPARIDRVVREAWHYARAGNVQFDDQGRVVAIDDFFHELRNQ